MSGRVLRVVALVLESETRFWDVRYFSAAEAGSQLVLLRVLATSLMVGSVSPSPPPLSMDRRYAVGTLPAHVRSVYTPNPGVTPGFRRPRPTTRRRHALCRVPPPPRNLEPGTSAEPVR